MGWGPKQDEAVKRAEQAIQKILLDLSSELGLTVDEVRVDTRNYANLSTEIFVS